jgi:non-canonical (house-cleaning) NTP pyrophosphatase
VALGSGSEIKIAAVAEAFGPSWEVLTVSHAESGVRPQPVGKEETLLGATTRSAAARAAHPEADLAIGIENGMWERQDDATCPWEDGACVVITSRGGVSFAVWSDTLPIPRQHPYQRGPNGEWSKLKDPHSVLTNGARPRQAFLRDALVAFLIDHRSGFQ